jgi:hypothetical protein
MALPNLKCSSASEARNTFSRVAFSLNGSTNETRRWFDKESRKGVDEGVDSVRGFTFAWNPSAHLGLEVAQVANVVNTVLLVS